jgi:hypothetical protein
LTWLDRQGKSLGTVGEAGGYSEIDLSPDEKRLAAVRNGDIWIIELDRNVTTRFTFDAANNRSPVWSRDGSRIAFEDGSGNLFVKPANGAILLLVPLPMLRQYFGSRGVLGDLPWDELTEKDHETVYAAWQALPQRARDAIGTDFLDAAGLATMRVQDDRIGCAGMNRSRPGRRAHAA